MVRSYAFRSFSLEHERLSDEVMRRTVPFWVFTARRRSVRRGVRYGVMKYRVSCRTPPFRVVSSPNGKALFGSLRYGSTLGTASTERRAIRSGQERRSPHHLCRLDADDLERRLRDAMISNHLNAKRKYRKILIVVEGIYSMEGTIVNLPRIIDIKRRYKAYLFIDEAHSIGK